MATPLFYRDASQNDTNQRYSLDESALTDRVLGELKKQSADGCLLCSFDAWDGEEED